MDFVPQGGLLGRLSRASWRKIGIFAASLVLFTLALELMKGGARELSPLISNLFQVNNPVSGLGFGWLFAYLVMGGSPVAAAALAFFDIGVLDQVSAFAMITGSRLGASLIVLLMGLVYVLRGHERAASLVTGLLALIVTASTYILALPIGFLMLSSSFLNNEVAVNRGDGLLSAFDRVFGPVVDTAIRFLPGWLVFLIGLALIVQTFNLFDKALPELDLESSAFSDVPRLLYRPVVTFGLGLVITLVTMSVSVSLGLLVPLSVRGYIRRENLVPYIMGCNITTFVDTLLAGLLLRNPEAAAIVLAQMVSVLIVSAVILLLFFQPYERTVLRLVSWLSEDKVRLAIFFLFIFLMPVALLILG